MDSIDSQFKGPAETPRTPYGGADGTPRTPLDIRIMAIMAAARFHGYELDRDDMRVAKGDTPPPAAFVKWLTNAGMWARAAKMRWRQLVTMSDARPVVIFLNDGSAALMVRTDASRNLVWLKDPAASFESDPVAVDELRLSQVWSGVVLMLRPQRGVAQDDEPFSFQWVLNLVMLEGKLLRDILIGSVVLAILTIFPPLIIMTVVDRVVTHRAWSTLLMVTVLLVAATIYEMIIGYCRRIQILYVATRLDAKLSLYSFRRLLGLPIDFFERTPTGEIFRAMTEANKIKEFLTGRLLATALDFITLIVILPVLFIINPTLSWILVACGACIMLIIFAFLAPYRRLYAKFMQAEVQKGIIMIETIQGIRTVKSLALEPSQKDEWDKRTAASGEARLAMQKLANWPATLVTPFESGMTRFIILIGAALMLSDTSGNAASVGSLFAFMMLGGRVAAPLVSLSKLIEDAEEQRSAIAYASQVLNSRQETTNPSAGLRPRFEGAISFNKVEFAYPGSRTKALDGVSFSVPAGTMLGLVGRSGSGKSTITRLLQGINRDYEGYVKIDGTDLREINLSHLRRSFGTVLQENFLFRGTIRENLLAGRAGLTLTDAVRAARLAGAEEFIERMPMGYETWIEEGSPNLSGGQRQRLAIARALIHDPRILILDEATSALDPESEALVNANIKRIAHNRTMVIVSHRLSSIMDCHQIMVMDRGKVIDVGPHDELVERCAIYRHLWMQQNRHMDAALERNAASAAAAALTQGG
jgi:HlyB family type I secretion system ABC transporter